MDESDQLIVCSDYMNETLTSIYDVSDKKIAVIPNGIEPASVEKKAQDIFPDLTNRKYIFSIGRIVKEKGFETILKSAAIAKSEGKNYFFIIAGKGPMLDSYKKQVREWDLGRQVEFVGYVNDEQRNALISGCEMAVIPSLYEPFGIVALETMILGKPTIVSKTGGMKGIVKHLQTGLLMMPGDPQSLLEQIEFLINNPQNAEQIGKKGSQVVKSLYGWKRIASDTSRVMEDMLLNKRVGEK